MSDSSDSSSSSDTSESSSSSDTSDSTGLGVDCTGHEGELVAYLYYHEPGCDDDDDDNDDEKTYNDDAGTVSLLISVVLQLRAHDEVEWRYPFVEDLICANGSTTSNCTRFKWSSAAPLQQEPVTGIIDPRNATTPLCESESKSCILAFSGRKRGVPVTTTKDQHLPAGFRKRVEECIKSTSNPLGDLFRKQTEAEEAAKKAAKKTRN